MIILAESGGSTTHITSRYVKVPLILFIIFLGAHFSPVFAEDVVGIDSIQSGESPIEAQLVNDANTGIDLLTNRRKPITANSSLSEVANEDVIDPEKSESVVVARAASNEKCEPEIGLTYKDSTPCSLESVTPPKGAPNVVFVVLDDVGFGGLGCFGGPVETPNIDRLAQGGLSYNNFHTTALCSPTRACLLTGRNHHSVGIGTIMEFPTGYPGYTTSMSKDAATISEMLVDQGYNTYCVGKWHLSRRQTPSMQQGPMTIGPLDVGLRGTMGSSGHIQTSGILT